MKNLKKIILRFLKNSTGFTLAELMIVIIIVATLAAIAIPIYKTSSEKAKGYACINNMRTIFSAWRIYNMSNNPGYTPLPPSGLEDWHDINWVNNTFRIAITEPYFGQQSGTDHGFYFASNLDPALGTGIYLFLRSYRTNKPNENMIIGYYFYLRSTNQFVFEGTWPAAWLPEE